MSNNKPQGPGETELAMRICEYTEGDHRVEVRNCLIELQDAERSFDPRMPPGADIVDDYMLQMFMRCDTCRGKVFVAELGGDVAGYVTILTKVQSEGIEAGDLEYGLVADLIVKRQFRGKGIGRQLLDAAERHARSNSVNWLRIGALSENGAARSLYESRGFSNLYIELEKDLRNEQ